MTNRRKTLFKATGGSAAIEFAVAAPVILTLIFGFLQFGIMFMASSGLEHAVDEGARHATLWPRPTPAEITAKLNDAKYGLQADRITGPTLVYGEQDGSEFVEVTMSYAQPMNFVLFDGPTINLTKTRRAYLL